MINALALDKNMEMWQSEDEEEKMSTRTPWGPSQSSHRYARGVTYYSTAGHGGIKVSPTMLAKMPEAWRLEDGWYEEDCDATLVILAFPLYFTQAQWEDALQGAKNWLPDELMAAGYVVRLEESFKLRQRAFDARHYGDYVVHGAWGDWHHAVPAGLVGVRAIVRATGAEAYFLVPKAEYEAPRLGHPFVIDPSRHPSCPPFVD